MSAPVEVALEQGSLEWHEHRVQYRNASETPYIMSLVIDGYKYPFGGPEDLRKVKSGEKVVEQTYAMRRGSALEPAARSKMEGMWGMKITPKVYTLGKYSASIDGEVENGDIIEIKVPMKGKESSTWKDVAAEKKVPVHYWYQVQHQLMVTGARRCIFVVYDGEGAITTVPVEPDHAAWSDISKAWEMFESGASNVTVRTDNDWATVALAYSAAKKEEEALQEKIATLRGQLVAMSSGAKTTGAGVTVTRLEKKGSVDYKAIPALKDVDLEQYRKPATEEVRITIEKEQ